MGCLIFGRTPGRFAVNKKQLLNHKSFFMFITVRVTKIGKKYRGLQSLFHILPCVFLSTNKKKKGLMWGEIRGIFKVIQLTGPQAQESLCYLSLPEGNP